MAYIYIFVYFIVEYSVFTANNVWFVEVSNKCKYISGTYTICIMVILLYNLSLIDNNTSKLKVDMSKTKHSPKKFYIGTRFTRILFRYI